MTLDAIVPADYPALSRLVWNRDPARPIPGVEALSLYEAGWRHLDPATLSPAERALIDALVLRHGNGLLLTTR